MTEVAEPSTARAARPRGPRSSIDALSYHPGRDLVERWAAEEPGWLGATRRAALEAFEALPTEPNQLYTPYVDLRAAALADVRAYEAPEGSPADSSPARAAGLAALDEFDEDRVPVVALDPAARRA
ncbi:MAG TPA: hypothetical protein VLA23_10030, partial [Candidatus Limnocylindrales bacterium]|nr:hypothetical protein [Candidatus Limnocylindrales bacterium]